MKMMTHTILAALALVAVASAQDVTYNFDQSVDFSKFKTYKWVEIPGGVQLDDLIARQIDSALQSQLAGKGLTKVDSDSPDLFIGYQVAVQNERQITAYGMGPRLGGMGMASAQTSTLHIGSLALDIYDSEKHIVWRGIATKTIDPGAKPDKRQKNIQKGAEKLLKNYPPTKK